MSLKELAVAVGGIYVEAKTSAKRRQTALEALKETKSSCMKITTTTVAS